MVRADFESGVYGFLGWLFYRVCRLIWRVRQSPKARATWSLWSYLVRFYSYFLFMGWLVNSRLRPLLPEKLGEREWERLKRMVAELNRRSEHYKAVRGDHVKAIAGQ